MNLINDLRIIFEDDDILIVDKPAGITVNRAETTRNEVTVQDWAEDYLQMAKGKWQIEEGNDFINRGGVVHRLDKETSGVLILAKNPEAFVTLQRQFKERGVKKVYTALAHGKLVPSIGEISVPVGRLPWNRRQFGVVPGGRESVTFYKVIGYYQDRDGEELYSYVEVSPKTGRTHQIRVHLKYLGFPIFADFLYAGRKTAKNDRKKLGRVFLHAAKIAFIHPKRGDEVLFESPLPSELTCVLEGLERIKD